VLFLFLFSSRRRHTRFSRDWSSDVCSSDLGDEEPAVGAGHPAGEGEVERGVIGVHGRSRGSADGPAVVREQDHLVAQVDGHRTSWAVGRWVRGAGDRSVAAARRRHVTVAATTTAAAVAAATAVSVDRRWPVVRATASHATPHTRAAAGASRPPPTTASPTPTTATATRTPTAHASGRPPPVKP